MSVRQPRSDFCLASVDGSQCGRTAPLVAEMIVHIHECMKVYCIIMHQKFINEDQLQV